MKKINMKTLAYSVYKAYVKAKSVRVKAYAPYSNFLVGACFKVSEEELYFTGANVENASLGATICAERGAICSSIGHGIQPDFEFLVLVTQEKGIPPCGLCLQVMAEFCKDDFPVYLADLNGVYNKTYLGELLPTSFRDLKINKHKK